MPEGAKTDAAATALAEALPAVPAETHALLSTWAQSVGELLSPDATRRILTALAAGVIAGKVEPYVAQTACTCLKIANEVRTGSDIEKRLEVLEQIEDDREDTE